MRGGSVVKDSAWRRVPMVAETVPVSVKEQYVVIEV
jgi:hypothetical protein